MDMHAVRRKNLKDLIASQGDGSVASFARSSGFTEARLSQLLSRSFRNGQNFGEKMARKIEQQCALSPLALDKIPDDLEELAAVRSLRPLMIGEPPIYRGPRHGIATRDIDIFRIEVRPDGTGFDLAPEVHGRTYEQVGVRLPWAYENNFDLKKLFAIKILGESMSPNLIDGDVVVVDPVQITPVDGGVFVLLYEKEAMFRRLSRDAGQWWLVADNSDQRRFARKVFHEGSVEIIGRVVLRETTKI